MATAAGPPHHAPARGEAGGGRGQRPQTSAPRGRRRAAGGENRVRPHQRPRPRWSHVGDTRHGGRRARPRHAPCRGRTRGVSVRSPDREGGNAWGAGTVHGAWDDGGPPPDAPVQAGRAVLQPVPLPDGDSLDDPDQRLPPAHVTSILPSRIANTIEKIHGSIFDASILFATRRNSSAHFPDGRRLLVFLEHS